MATVEAEFRISWDDQDRVALLAALDDVADNTLTPDRLAMAMHLRRLITERQRWSGVDVGELHQIYARWVQKNLPDPDGDPYREPLAYWLRDLAEAIGQWRPVPQAAR